MSTLQAPHKTSNWRGTLSGFLLRPALPIVLATSFILPANQFFTLPPASNPTPPNMPTTISHRGAAALAPENTLPAIQAGIDGRAGYIEIDVHLTKDNQLIVMHDKSVNRTTNGRGKIRDLLLADIKKLDAGAKFSPEFAGTRVPTLREAIARCLPTSSVLTIEVKSPPKGSLFHLKLLQELEEMNALEKVVVISFDLDFIKRLRDEAPGLKVGNLYVFPPKNIPDAELISVHHLSATFFRRRIRRYQEKGVKVWVWTVNSKKKAQRLADQGLDGVVSDYPTILVD